MITSLGPARPPWSGPTVALVHPIPFGEGEMFGGGECYTAEPAPSRNLSTTLVKPADRRVGDAGPADLLKPFMDQVVPGPRSRVKDGEL